MEMIGNWVLKVKFAIAELNDTDTLSLWFTVLLTKSGTDVESFVSQTSVKIFDVPVENHILLFTPTNSETFNAIYENYKSAAAEFRGKVCNAEPCFTNMNAERSMEKHSPMVLVKVHSYQSIF